MDRNRNDDITPEDTELSGVGNDVPRETDKFANARNNKDVAHGRDGFKGRSGEASGGSGSGS
jgi:hypothetical protein